MRSTCIFIYVVGINMYVCVCIYVYVYMYVLIIFHLPIIRKCMYYLLEKVFWHVETGNVDREMMQKRGSKHGHRLQLGSISDVGTHEAKKKVTSAQLKQTRSNFSKVLLDPGRRMYTCNTK